MSEPVHGGPVLDVIEDAFESVYHSLGNDEAAVEAALRAFLGKYGPDVVAFLSPLPDGVDRKMVYPMAEELLVRGVKRMHDKIHQD